jgi:glycosyltransferase involved in cell wall biosynthesis
VLNVSINGKFFSQRITGTQRYARELLHRFDHLLCANNPWKIAATVLVPKNADGVPAYKNLQVRTVGKLTGTRWEQLELPRSCQGEILLTLSGGAPLRHRRNVVTLHDAAVVAAPAGYSLPYRLWHGYVCRKMAQNAELIFTNSHFSKSEVVKWYGAPPEKIYVTYLGSEHFRDLTPDPSTLNRFGISGKYVLAVSSHNPNKNFRGVVEAVLKHCRSGVQLVIAGAIDSRVYRQSQSLPEEVKVVGYVSDPELKALYQNASCFVFASFYEGFGLPPLEAMVTGCPVVLSRIPSLTELFDGAAFFCDPYRPKDVAEAIDRAVQPSHAQREHLEEFAEKFSWENCARQTLDRLSAL